VHNAGTLDFMPYPASGVAHCTAYAILGFFDMHAAPTRAPASIVAGSAHAFLVTAAIVAILGKCRSGGGSQGQDRGGAHDVSFGEAHFSLLFR
jgi:hypothetical protein